MLESVAIEQAFAFILIFCRIGTAFSFVPGIGEAYVPVRVRLAFALATTFVLLPILKDTFPPVPSSPLAVFVLILAESMVGLFVGLITRILIATTHMAGMIIAFQSGLASAIVYDFGQLGQGSAIGNFFGLTVLVLFFATDLHHLLIRGLMDSYSLFLPGQFPPVDDFSNMAARLTSKIFLMAIQISSPLLVMGLVVYTAAGILARLMPLMPVFFIITAPQLLISFFIIMVTFSAIMLWYMSVFQETLMGFLAP